MNIDRIFLIGLSGSGKSTVARLVATRLGWDCADTDLLVEQAAGRSVAELFAEEGEAQFRYREQVALEQVSRLEQVVVATGGGAPTTPPNRDAIGRGFVVWLAVSPEKAASRLNSNPDTEDRPLLLGDTRARLQQLLDARRSIYELADAAVDVESLTPQQAADEIVRLWQEAKERGFGQEPRTPNGHQRPRLVSLPSPLRPDGVAARVITPLASYPVIVREGVLAELGERCRDLGLTGRAFVITDDEVGPLHAAPARKSLETAGYTVEVLQIPSGEAHKNLQTLEHLYDHLLDARVERTDFAVCLGGGVVTDLGGFAAATCLRGIDFLHVPTSLLGMVDAAIGGKVGIDHPRGKNMIGAFAQPRAVIIDPAVLQTLPERHLRNGFAELIKHGLILDASLVARLEQVADTPAAMASEELIAASVAIKAEVVSEDEREAGRRTLLNYGHTIGHAIEAVTGYTEYLHGEAVAVGMRAAGLIAVELGMLTRDDFDRQQELIAACGLPLRAPGLPVDAVLDVTRSDKKVREGAIRWVLLEGLGNAVVCDGVPDDVVRRAVETVLA